MNVLKFEFVAHALLRLPSSFRNKIFPLLVNVEKKYVRKVVDRMTQGSRIPTDSVKSGDYCSSLFHNIRYGAYIDSDKANLTYLIG